MKNLIIVNGKKESSTGKILADYLHKSVLLEGYSLIKSEEEMERKIGEHVNAENIIISCDVDEGYIKNMISKIKNKAYRFIVFSVIGKKETTDDVLIKIDDTKTARESAMIIAYKVKQKTM